MSNIRLQKNYNEFIVLQNLSFLNDMKRIDNRFPKAEKTYLLEFKQTVSPEGRTEFEKLFSSHFKEQPFNCSWEDNSVVLSIFKAQQQTFVN